MPGVGERHRDAAAHGARAQDGHPANRQRRCAARDVRDLRGGTLGEEDVPESLGLGRFDRLGEELALAREPLVERQVRSRLDRIDAAQGCLTAAGSSRRILPSLLEDLGVLARVLDVRGQVAGARQRTRRRDALGERNGGLQEVSLVLANDLVDEAQVLGRRGADRARRW